jgi:protein tyrosine phosphatase (PTP) superfamily phosphohydrolase (DUF442 family)
MMKVETKTTTPLAHALTLTLVFSTAMFHANAFAHVSEETHTSSHSAQEEAETLASLTNLQHNNTFMLSSGLPTQTHLSLLKSEGVNHIIDLIPGDRTNEIQFTSELDLDYFNVPVDWESPSVANFLNYAAYMNKVRQSGGKVLTHCKLNWRGASFTYLYRVAVLSENEESAKADLMKIWHPNPTWHKFMSDVIGYYNSINNANVAMSFDPAPVESE